MGADVVAPRLRLTFDLLYHRIRRFIGGRRPGAGDIVLRLVEGQHGRLRASAALRGTQRRAPLRAAQGPRSAVPLRGTQRRCAAPQRRAQS